MDKLGVGMLSVKSEGNVYWPDEDSKLLLSALMEEEGSLLEIGCGSGFVCLNYAFSKKFPVYCSDISEEALEVTTKNAQTYSINIETIHSDLFENIEGSYDIIAFNPPYLSLEVGESLDISLHDISDIIKRYIKEVPNYLKVAGRAYLITSTDHVDSKEIDELLFKNGWQLIKQKPMGYGESLKLWKLVKT